MKDLARIATVIGLFAAGVVANAQEETVTPGRPPCKVSMEHLQQTRAEAIEAIQRSGLSTESFKLYERRISSGKRCPDRRKLSYYYRVLGAVAMD